jgi:uncharacterized membrane protein
MNWHALKFGAIYSALVFSAGLVLGTIRVLALEPRIGIRYAELSEMPVMLFVIYLSARYVVSRMNFSKAGLPYLIVGVTALALLLLVEFALVLGLQDMSLGQYLDSRDEIAFGAYIISLIVFALMPWLIKVRNYQNDT